ncbi:hypothetical protein RCL_jg5978.t1 [Rhizophagus clarus]|uniref:Uncharacterized protein n=1 Tax=Rhizophagus clarus TaxID=94130 RepID=A0A8H3QX14_9GLOM|nr:hypothetical protein RCL_jg5978.t1 [Rhizophagus clarus]
MDNNKLKLINGPFQQQMELHLQEEKKLMITTDLREYISLIFMTLKLTNGQNDLTIIFFRRREKNRNSHSTVLTPDED